MIPPEPKEQPDFSLLTSPDGEFWLAYELPRDFLSAPRQYAVLSGSLGVDGQMIWLQPPQTDPQEQPEAFWLEEDGVYLLTISNAQQELRLCACAVQLVEILFHPQGPQVALLASLGALFTS